MMEAAWARALPGRQCAERNELLRWLRDQSRSRLIKEGDMAPANRARPYTYNVSSNGAAGDWYWEVTTRGQIIARGVAATEVLARADALRAALSHVDPRPENLRRIEDPLPA